MSSKLFLILFFCIILTACGGSSSNSSSSSLHNELQRTRALQALRESILTIPANIQLIGEASSGKKYKTFAYEGLWANHYAAVTDNINYSDRVKKNVISLLDYIFDSQDIANTPLGVFTETGEGEIWAFKIEDISNIEGEEFKWKLSLYFRFSQVADVICRFSFVDGKMKGQILENGYLETEITLNSFSEFETESETITTDIRYDIRFDGTTLPQTLEINYVKDMSQIISFAELNWPDMPEDQWDILNLSQTGKSSVKITYDGEEYSITGTGYSPGADLERQIFIELNLYGENHSTFSFRAKSISNEVDGAKLEVALPENTLDDISTIWVSSSVSGLFEKNMTEYLESYLGQLLNEDDDTTLINTIYADSALLNSISIDGNLEQEKQAGVNLLFQLLGDEIGIASLTEHGVSLTQTEFDTAVNFWGMTDFANINGTTLVDYNNYLGNNDGSISNSQKQRVYYFAMANQIVDYYQLHSIDITISQIEKYLTERGDANAIGLLQLIQSKKNVFNPAFFDANVGFLGTYDGNDFFEYVGISDSLVSGEKPENFEMLNALDLSVLDAIKPIDVYEMSIVVE